MTTSVSVSEYRAKLRDWHDRARGGETIVVTERGEPVVRVTDARAESVLERLAREGVLTPGRERRLSDLIDAVPAPGDSTPTISAQRER